MEVVDGRVGEVGERGGEYGCKEGEEVDVEVEEIDDREEGGWGRVDEGGGVGVGSGG